MPQGKRLHSWVVAGLGFVGTYVLLAWVGRELGAIGSLTVWYPPAGLAAAGSVIIGWRAIPLAAMGELIGGVVVFDADSAFSNGQLVVNAVGYAAVWGGAGELLRRWVGADLRDILPRVPIVLFGMVGLAPLAAAAWGVTMQDWAGFRDKPFLEAVGLWWTGDAVGVASVAPSLIVVAYALTRPSGYRLFRPEPVWLTTLQLLSPVAMAAAVFAFGANEVRFPYLVFIPIAMVALRHGVEGAALCTLGLTPVVTVLIDALKPTAIDQAELQALLLVGIGTGLVIGAVVSDRERWGRMHRELSTVIETTPDLVTISDQDGVVTYLNPAARRAAGLAPRESLEGRRDTDLNPNPLAKELIAQRRRAALRDGSWTGEVQLRTADGRDIVGDKLVIRHPSQPGVAPRVTTMIRDVTEQRRLAAELDRGARYDSLTGLPNRTLLIERLARALQQGRTVMLLMVPIDRFRVITEGVGHRDSDAVITTIAERLSAHTSTSDTVARLSTDAFAILPGRDLDEVDAVSFGESLIEAVSGTIELRGQALPVTVSVGAASSEQLPEVDELIRAAEVAAHRAADAGGARTVLFSEHMSDRAKRRLEIEHELRDALQSERWWLAYQPIVEIASERVVSAEALLRWTGPDGEPVSPFEFILLAEEIGLIVPLGQSVLQRACIDSVGWSSPSGRVTVAVNVSARQLTEPGFAASVAEVLRVTGIDPGLVTLELTETSFAGENSIITPLLDELSDLGVELAMDDFGTGYSSLAQMGGLPLDKVKLDKSFIDDLVTSRRCRDLVRGVINLSHALGLIVIAEGVEDEEQLAILADFGCDRAQGYLFSRPVPSAELEALLQAGRSEATSLGT